MKKLFTSKLSIFACTILMALSASFFYFGNPFASGKPEKEEDEEGMSKRQSMEAYYKLEFDKTADRKLGYIPTERLILAKAQMDRQNRSLRAPVGLTWTERGPNNVGGRTRALIFDKNDATNKKVWAGGVGGGLWFTNDITAATPTWNKVNDLFSTIVINAMAQEPNSTPAGASSSQYMYFGTGGMAGQLGRKYPHGQNTVTLRIQHLNRGRSIRFMPTTMPLPLPQAVPQPPF